MRIYKLEGWYYLCFMHGIDGPHTYHALGKVGEITYTEAISAAFYLAFEHVTNGGI